MNAFVRPAKHTFVAIDEIDLNHTIRPYNASVVTELAQSIRAIGLQTPLTCIVRDGHHVLVSGRTAPQQTARPLRDLVGISGGELARWIKITTPNDRPHVVRVLETAASILRDELEGRNAA